MTKRERAIVAAAEAALDAFFEWERGGGPEARRAVRSAAIRLAIAQRKNTGRHFGRVAYGFRFGEDGRLRPYESERRVVEIMSAWRRDGLSFAQIAARLGREGIKNREGLAWKRLAVYQVLVGRARDREVFQRPER